MFSGRVFHRREFMGGAFGLGTSREGAKQQAAKGEDSVHHGNKIPSFVPVLNRLFNRSYEIISGIRHFPVGI